MRSALVKLLQGDSTQLDYEVQCSLVVGDERNSDL